MTPDPYAFEERAAILEYDAADCYPTREAAERRAAQLEARISADAGTPSQPRRREARA
jgi:hypothetical protein